MWRRCYFRTEKAESSTVRLVPGGSCDGLQAVLVRDDDLDLTLSRPSSGFGTFQLEAVMFRNPNWFVYRKPLRSSFCTCLSLSMSCDVVCFFSARPPCGQPQTALTIRRLRHRRSKGHLRISCDQRRLRTRQVQLAAAQPLFCSSLSISRKGGRWLQSSVHGGEMR